MKKLMAFILKALPIILKVKKQEYENSKEKQIAKIIKKKGITRERAEEQYKSTLDNMHSVHVVYDGLNEVCKKKLKVSTDDIKLATAELVKTKQLYMIPAYGGVKLSFEPFKETNNQQKIDDLLALIDAE